MKIEVHRYPDGRLKSIEGSTENYEFWIDENGNYTCMSKDTKFDELILKLIDGHEEALREQLNSSKKASR